MIARVIVALLVSSILSIPALAAEPRRVLVWLEGEPLAELHVRNQLPIPGFVQPMRLDSRDMLDRRAALRSHRAGILQQLERLGFVMDGETDVVLHALMGRMPEENVEAANAILGVRLARPVVEYRLHLDAAVPLVGAGSAWMVLGGETKAGRGVKIAIIDTGIDINHPMLQDPTLTVPSGYPKGQKDFTNSKVIVARDYLSMLGDPRDTPNAMDRYGHGTFVAAIVAGRRAIAPWAEVAGVAPGAQLGNYRIYASPLNFMGDDFTTDAIVIAAINDAVADGMNIVNFSSGTPYLDVPSEEPVAQAVEAAVKAGVIFAVSAGNDGSLGTSRCYSSKEPCLASIGNPATSPAAIAVGASENGRLFANAVRLVGPEGVPEKSQRMAGAPAARLTMTEPLGPAPIIRLTLDACNASLIGPEVKDKVVLVSATVNTSGCSRSSRIRNLAGAGAIGMLVYRSDDALPASFSYLNEKSEYVAPRFPLWRYLRMRASKPRLFS